jgi:hypothetical protein
VEIEKVPIENALVAGLHMAEPTEIIAKVSGDGVIPPAGVTLKTRHFEWD